MQIISNSSNENQGLIKQMGLLNKKNKLKVVDTVTDSRTHSEDIKGVDTVLLPFRVDINGKETSNQEIADVTHDCVTIKYLEMIFRCWNMFVHRITQATVFSVIRECVACEC